MATPLMRPPSATGVVLAGGASSRLGRDKALATVGDRPMLTRVVDAVSVACSETLVAGDPTGREELELPGGARWIPDRYTDKGPLAGLHAGLAEAHHDLVVAVGCDMPFLNGLLLVLLLRVAEEDRQLYQAVVPRVGGRLQPLHAVYHRSCARQVEELLATEASPAPSLHGLVSRLRVRYVEEAELRPFDPELRSFLSVNTEEELERAERLLGPPR